MELMELWAIFGPGVAGAVFGAGWWIWVDAVVCSSVKVSFLHYLPGSRVFSPYISLFLCMRYLSLLGFKLCFLLLFSSPFYLLRNFRISGGFDVQLC